jgi:hypothetical protein
MIPARNRRRTNTIANPRRLGCGYCFRTLDPTQRDALNQAFTRCTTCKRDFHQIHIAQSCPVCASDQLIPVRIAPPPPLRVVVRRPVALVGLVTPDGSGGAAPNRLDLGLTSYFNVIRHGVRLTLLGLVALLFIAIAAGLGAYTLRLVQINQAFGGTPGFPQRLVDSVLRETPPPARVFALTFLAASVTAYALFPVTLRDKDGERSFMRWVWRIVGGAVLLVAINIVVWDITFTGGTPLAVMVNDLLSQERSDETVIGQFGAIVLTILLAVPYLIITRNPPSPPRYPWLLSVLRVMGSLARYLIVFYLLLCLLVSVGMTQLGGSEGFVISFIPSNQEKFTFAESRILVMALTALAVGLLLYHFPPYRLRIAASRPLNIAVRLIGALVCLGLAAYFYVMQPAPLLVEAAALGGGLALVMLPIQRAYS